MNWDGDIRNYTMILRREITDHGGVWVARAAELPGCEAAEKSPEAAVQHLLASIPAYIEVQMGRNRPVPPPANGPGGRLLIRIPKWVHRELKSQAESDGISLNQHVAGILTYWAGYGVPPKKVVEQVVAASDPRPF